LLKVEVKKAEGERPAREKDGIAGPRRLCDCDGAQCQCESKPTK